MAAAATTLLEQLAAQAGPGAAVRAGSDDDAVDGVRPRLVAAPANGEALAATLAWASSEGLPVRVSGGGTKQDWGTPGPGSICCCPRRRSPASSSIGMAT